MSLEYISYIQTEKLFKAWPTIQGIKESLELELKTLTMASSEEKDEYIYTKIVGNKVISDIPPTGKISDTTGEIATKYVSIIEQDYYETLETIKKDKFYIELVDDKMNIAFRRLNPTQQQLLKLFYWERKTWAEVLEELKKEKHFMSKHQAQTQRRLSLEKLQKISKITVDMYEYVMNLLEVE